MHVKAKSAADQWLNTDYIKPHAPRSGAGSPAFRLPRNPQQASEMGSAGPTKSQPTHSVFLQTAAVTLHLTKTGAWKFITAWCPSAAHSSAPHRDGMSSSFCIKELSPEATGRINGWAELHEYHSCHRPGRKGVKRGKKQLTAKHIQETFCWLMGGRCGRQVHLGRSFWARTMRNG